MTHLPPSVLHSMSSDEELMEKLALAFSLMGQRGLRRTASLTVGDLAKLRKTRTISDAKNVLRARRASRLASGQTYSPASEAISRAARNPRQGVQALERKLGIPHMEMNAAGAMKAVPRPRTQGDDLPGFLRNSQVFKDTRRTGVVPEYRPQVLNRRGEVIAGGARGNYTAPASTRARSALSRVQARLSKLMPGGRPQAAPVLTPTPMAA
jgi:hypothetical protein